jgi:serine/tyrosine/threonine adenylyltransferase
MRKLTELTFDNTYARLPAAFHDPVSPTPVPDPYLVSFNGAAADLIDLDPAEAARPEFVEYFAGNKLLPGSESVAMKYAGHQFGVYVPQLGDGRAILLGEVRNDRGQKWDLHLKGSGQTAFSRRGDGRAVLRSTIREYLCSEAMHGLGIPTTRALCIVGSDMPVYRERQETGALLLRMAPSHVRFGSFEVFFHRGQHEELRTLADYVIAEYFPELVGTEDRYVRFYGEVVRRTAELLARWQAVGFAHGVMNTDNMSILGLTLDYGPFGFMEEFDRGYVCNHSDETGRYAFDQQPMVAYWNLACLGGALTPLAPAEALTEVLNTYPAAFNEQLDGRMREKLGLSRAVLGDTDLWSEALNLLAEQKVDYTTFFRALGDFDPRPGAVRGLFACPNGFDAWADRYRARLEAESLPPGERKAKMDRVNPRYILRNYLAQQAISRAEDVRDFSEVDRLLDLLRDPFADRPGMDEYAKPAPAWGKHLTISCSS